MRIQIGDGIPLALRVYLKFGTVENFHQLDTSSIDRHPHSFLRLLIILSALYWVTPPLSTYFVSYYFRMPPLRKDRAQASRLQHDNALQFNTFINVSIPKAPQVLSEEALQLRPTIPAKTVRFYIPQ